MVDLETLNNTPISRLVELAEADKDGRVVVLPCRQGDELWTYCNHPVKRVYSFTVSDVSTLNGRTRAEYARARHDQAGGHRQKPYF